MDQNKSGVKNNTPQNISWPMKLALALAFLPVIWLLIALALKASNIEPALPTIPFLSIYGSDVPNNLFFTTEYTDKNLFGSVIFCSIAFFVGFWLFCHLAVARKSFSQAFKDVIHALKNDINALLQDDLSKHNKSSITSHPTKADDSTGKKEKEPPSVIKWVGKQKTKVD